MNALKIIGQWIFLAALGFGIWWLWCKDYYHLAFAGLKWQSMPGGMVIIFALSLAFYWVEILKWGITKPFNCMKCMTGWFAVFLAFFFNTPYWLLYLPLGVFAGAMFSAVKMRWL